MELAGDVGRSGQCQSGRAGSPGDVLLPAVPRHRGIERDGPVRGRSQSERVGLKVECVASGTLDGRSGHEILRLGMGLQEPFHPAAQPRHRRRRRDRDNRLAPLLSSCSARQKRSTRPVTGCSWHRSDPDGFYTRMRHHLPALKSPSVVFDQLRAPPARQHRHGEVRGAEQTITCASGNSTGDAGRHGIDRACLDRPGFSRPRASTAGAGAFARCPQCDETARNPSTIKEPIFRDQRCRRGP